MRNFDLYAKYYDLLYQDKDYSKEVDYIHSLIKENEELQSKRILDLGCGTGKHAYALSSMGYAVDGVDNSAEMISIAKSKFSKIENLQFFKGDATNWKHPHKHLVDVVISLFHVLSYQTMNESVLNMFMTAFEHLKPGGLFIFDCWYGPAVLSERPQSRSKTLRNNEIHVRRLSKPIMHIMENVVDVNFEVTITAKESGKQEFVKELHRMRYFFIPELKFFAEQIGFKSAEFMTWLGTERPTDQNWYIVGVLKKPKN